MKILILLLLWAGLLLGPNNNPGKEEFFLVTYKIDLKPFKSKYTKVTETARLYISDEKSIFLDEKLDKHLKLERESPSPAERESRIMEIGPPRFSYIIIKDLARQKYNRIEEHFTKEYIGYEAPGFDKNSWHILPDTSTISNLLTYKATCQYGGRNWNAWFTTEIPISDGPYKFSGLPGLILKLESEDGDYTFSIVGMQKVSLFPHIPDFKTVSSEKYEELISLSSNPILKMESNGIKLGTMKMNGKVVTREELILSVNKDLADKNHIEKQ